jgi:hypothetical protein
MYLLMTLFVQVLEVFYVVGSAFSHRYSLEFRLSRSKSAIALIPANVHTRTATVAGEKL